MSMNGDYPQLGGYFSRTYLAPEELLPDDSRARLRLAVYLQKYYQDEIYSVGHYIESELGIKCLSIGASSHYINWEEFLAKLATKDFLDVVTATIKLSPNRRKQEGHATVSYNLLEFARRVFSEQSLAYSIDSKGGCHPKIDPAFSIASANLIRNLTESGQIATREHISIAERSLRLDLLDLRQAIRSTFDAAENLFKTTFPRETQLNKESANRALKPYLLSTSGVSDTERRAAEKLVNSIIDWIEAAHFYRHASGDVEPAQPSEPFTIAFVSQGFSIIRWISDVRPATDTSASVSK